ncbi:LysR family transcriptional regulator [Oceanobacter mangrovi]|uniref:LysR family transcriptional regulator n=1 Tax=Oceanobacter mangrovi TaxID=2862510 RepID=UPI001C8D5F8F|nr:LysR family transcriptional regulator [Oceanobacter mangrovi]
MKTTLEQWRMFKAVVEHGGYAQAADAIHKSQSTISYGVHKLQEQLGIVLLEVEGRKAVLTEHGKVMLQRANQLLEQAENMDKAADVLRQGVEPIVRLALDMIFPYERLFSLLQDFSSHFPDTRVELTEFVMNGGNDMLERGEIDLLVTPIMPAGMKGKLIHRERFVPVSSPAHPLQQQQHLRLEDLTEHRQIVMRDSSRHRRDSGWLGAHQRWTVSHTYTSLNIVLRGLGYAWLPMSWISTELDQGHLRALPMREDYSRYEDLFLVEAAAGGSGPATRYLAKLLGNCSEHMHPDQSTTE